MQLTFGDRLLLLRKKQQLTRQQLSIRMTVSEEQLAEWENDKTYPSLQQAIKLADLLDTSLDFLACRIEEQPNKKWLTWAADIDQLSTKNRHALFFTVEALINVDKVDKVYNEA
jgi:transcriptional regulator with XRE-family HTH domain